MHLYTDGIWSTTSSTLDKTTTAQELYSKLGILGFQQSQEVLYRGGTARLYTRVAQQGKVALPIGFEFCCILYLGTFLYAVGLKSLQDVLRFYQEIDAHPKETEAITATHFQALTECFTDIVEHLEDAGVTINNLSSIKFALDELTTTLATIGNNLQQPVLSHPQKALRKATQGKKNTIVTHF